MAGDWTASEYPNFETYAAALWIDNDEIAQATVLTNAPHFESPYTFSKWLAQWAEGYFRTYDLPQSGLVRELFNSAWQQINWRYLADDYIESAPEIIGGSEDDD